MSNQSNNMDALMDDKEHLGQKLREKIKGKQLARRTKKVPKKNGTPDGIYETVESIQYDRKQMSFPNLLAKYKDFSEEHLEIFRVASSRDMSQEDMARLKDMILQKEMIENGQITLEEASSMTSEQLARRYQPDLLKNNN